MEDPPPKYDENSDVIEHIHQGAFEMVISNIKQSTRKEIEIIKQSYETRIEEMKQNHETQIEEMKQKYETQIEEMKQTKFITPEIIDFIIPYLVDVNKDLTKKSIEYLQKYNEEQKRYHKIEKEYNEKIREHEKLLKERDFFVEKYEKERSFVEDRLNMQKDLLSNLNKDLEASRLVKIEAMKENESWKRTMSIEDCKVKEQNIKDDIREITDEIEKLDKLLTEISNNINYSKKYDEYIKIIDIESQGIEKIQKDIDSEIETNKEIINKIDAFMSIRNRKYVTLNQRTIQDLRSSRKQSDEKLECLKRSLQDLLSSGNQTLKKFFDENKIFKKVYDNEIVIENHDYHDKSLKENLIRLEQEKNKCFEKTVTCENILEYLK